jgi:hypothetical protein
VNVNVFHVQFGLQNCGLKSLDIGFYFFFILLLIFAVFLCKSMGLFFDKFHFVLKMMEVVKDFLSYEHLGLDELNAAESIIFFDVDRKVRKFNNNIVSECSVIFFKHDSQGLFG